MPKDRYGIYLKEFEQKFVAINQSYEVRNRAVGKELKHHQAVHFP
jgi:hypothetical protein